MPDETKQKRGRKKGSTDSVDIKLSALIDILPKGTESVIPVRRKWITDMERILGVKFMTNDEPTIVENDFHPTEKKQSNTMVEEIL